SQNDRKTSALRTLSVGDLLNERVLVLRADLLGAWSHWITPAFEPRRYDTRFFVAVLPHGQSVGGLPGEADRGAWMPVHRLIESVDAGHTHMLPPTRRTCVEISEAHADHVLSAAASRTISPREPKLVEIDGEAFLQTDLEP